MSSETRMNRNKYFMEIAELTAKRGTCDRAQVGAVAVKNKRVIMSGYNGSPPGLAHCDDVGHLMVNNHCLRTVHAEQNLITQCAKAGISLDEAIVYVTHEPCFECLKLLISAGVDVIFFKKAKADKRTPLEYYNSVELYQLDGDKIIKPIELRHHTLNEYEKN